MRKIVLIGIAALLAFSCTESPLEADPDKGEEVAIEKVDHGMIELGDKLEDPYSVKNVTKALSSLYPTKADRVDVTPTNIYVRFLPEDEEQFGELESMGIDLLDHPVDYRIVREGDYYHDPEIDEGRITWQYAVVPPDFKFPEDVEYEILDECYIPENAATRASEDGVDWNAVIRESFRLTGNGDMLLPETRGEKVHPKGRITIVDDKANGGKPFGVAGVKVACNVFVKFSTGYTDRDGYYVIKGSFSANPRYRIVFQNENNFAIGFNLILIPASMSTLGKHGPEGIDVTVTEESEGKLFRRCVVNNAAWEYIERCREDDMDLTLPPRSLRIWIFKNMSSSSASMLRHGAFISNSLIGDFLGEYRELVQCFLPDITIGAKNNDDYASLYNVTVHEMAHASHYAQVGNEYWDNYIKYIIESFIRAKGVAYGEGTTSGAGYCEVGEMWGYFMENTMYNDRYGGNPPSFGTSYWFYPQILRYLYDRGITRSELLRALTSDVTDRDKLQARLSSLYPEKKDIIDQVFARYNK